MSTLEQQAEHFDLERLKALPINLTYLHEAEDLVAQQLGIELPVAIYVMGRALRVGFFKQSRAGGRIYRNRNWYRAS